MTALAAEDRERVGPYRVLKAIGAGGSARIDLARIDRAYGFQRHVVLKRPLEHLRGDPAVAASLRREARIGGRLRHPNLVAVLDAGVHDGYDYLALEYVHGAALRTVMHADAPGQVRDLPLAVALAIVSDAARGIHEAHELTDEHGAPLGLVHRDVSPGNLLLGLDGTVKLADFGIAKETRVATLSGSMHGTVTYMAPEQCQGHAFDRRADVFSLGVILYELVTGARLFWADNDVASLHRVLSGTVPRPRKLRPQLAPALEDLVLTAVAHDASRRFPTALALATELERYAARTGEVLGARWIARTMERVVGPKPVPWLAAPAVTAAGMVAGPAPMTADAALVAVAVPTMNDAALGGATRVTSVDIAPPALVAVAALTLTAAVPTTTGAASSAAGTGPASDSLVELIAMAPDEPVDPTFGAGDVATEPEAGPAVPRDPARARQRWLAGALAVVAAGAVAIALVARSTPPVAPPRSAPASGARAVIAPTSTAPTSTAPTSTAPTSTAPTSTAPTIVDRAPARDRAIDAATPARPPGTQRAKWRGSSGSRTAPASEPAIVEPAGPTAPVPPPTPATAAAAPSKVEWKPTLLLPTDGSAHR